MKYLTEEQHNLVMEILTTELHNLNELSLNADKLEKAIDALDELMISLGYGDN